jgi:hypothetical protein
MTTQTDEVRLATALRRRIQKFYNLLNHGEYEKCFLMVDPVLREDPTSITALRYAKSLESFREWSGGVNILEIRPLRLHLNEPNRQYDNRDFALTEIDWEDKQGEQHTFKERWVRDRRGWWFTRGTGFITPGN